MGEWDAINNNKIYLSCVFKIYIYLLYSTYSCDG